MGPAALESVIKDENFVHWDKNRDQRQPILM